MTMMAFRSAPLIFKWSIVLMIFGVSPVDVLPILALQGKNLWDLLGIPGKQPEDALEAWKASLSDDEARRFLPDFAKICGGHDNQNISSSSQNKSLPILIREYDSNKEKEILIEKTSHAIKENVLDRAEQLHKETFPPHDILIKMLEDDVTKETRRMSTQTLQDLKATVIIPMRDMERENQIELAQIKKDIVIAAVRENTEMKKQVEVKCGENVLPHIKSFLKKST